MFCICCSVVGGGFPSLQEHYGAPVRAEVQANQCKLATDLTCVRGRPSGQEWWGKGRAGRPDLNGFNKKRRMWIKNHWNHHPTLSLLFGSSPLYSVITLPVFLLWDHPAIDIMIPFLLMIVDSSLLWNPPSWVISGLPLAPSGLIT